MSKKQTAVEWLEQQTRTPDWHSLKRGEIFEKAKEIEKKNLIDAFIGGEVNVVAAYCEQNNLKFEITDDKSEGEQYYNNTFNQ
jgi:hypothetical protein